MTYERNMAVIRRRWSAVASAIDGAPLTGCTWLTGTREGTVVYNGVCMTGAHDRATEAKVQASIVPAEVEQIWCFGVGMGDLPRELLKRDKETIVAVLNLSVTKAALVQVDMTDWLAHEKTVLCLASDLADGINVPSNAPFATVPMELRFADKNAYSVRDVVFGAINSRFNIGIQYKSQLPMDQAHWDENKQHMAVDASVTTLFAPPSYTKAIIAVPGPSLDGQLDWIRETRQPIGNGYTHLLFCVNSSLPILVKAGIVPDVCIVLDSAESIVKCLDGLGLPTPNPVALVYEPVVTPALVGAWPGTRYFAVTNDLWHAGTVTHAAVDLAVRMGATHVTLLGADFCHPKMKSHAGDAPDHYAVHDAPAAMMPTVNGLGEDVHTIPCLAIYHRKLEEYIGKHPEVTWCKRGRQGVAVKGCTWTD